MDGIDFVFVDCVDHIHSHCSYRYTPLSQTETALKKNHR